MNINNKSFSIDSNPNNSSNPIKPRISQIQRTQPIVQKNNQNQYQISPSLLTYSFRNAHNQATNNSLIDNGKKISGNQNVANKQSKTYNEKQIVKEDSKFNRNKLSQIIQNQNSAYDNNNTKSKGLLKQSMKVQYEFGQIKSQLINSHYKKESYERPAKSDITNSTPGIMSANIFSCMDAPDYQRDFQVSPKVMSRR